MVLKEYAHKKNRTVLFTIHQPNSDIWHLFDRVILLIEGKFIYQGPGAYNVVNYFADCGFKCPNYCNPADYLMSIMHSESEVNKSNFELYFKNY